MQLAYNEICPRNPRSTMILAIESTCDESGIALVSRDNATSTRFTIEFNVVSSQVAKHTPFGGVVPRIAAREHSKNFPILLDQLTSFLHSRGLQLNTIERIAYAHEPGLEPSLLIGANLARSMAYFLDLPLQPVNHVFAHLFSPLIHDNAGDISVFKGQFPLVGLVVSGAHTRLYVLRSVTDWEIIGDTRDDAAGEAFDKIARMLGFPYPGGPHIERVAHAGDPKKYPFPRGLIESGDYEFSFSGLKTSVRYMLRDLGFMTEGVTTQNTSLPDSLKADIAASAQRAIIDILVTKTLSAALEYNAKGVIIGGGVVANQAIIEQFRLAAEQMPEPLTIYVPDRQYATDNAAMIGVAALAL